MKKIFLFSSSALLSLVIATSAEAFTVKDSVEAALSNNNNILSGKEDVKIASEGVNQALGEFLPTIQYKYSRQFTAPYSGTKAVLGFVATGDLENPVSHPVIVPSSLPNNVARTDTISMNQNLFAGGRSAASYKNASKLEKAAEKRQEANIQEQIFRIISAHTQVIAAREKLQAYEQDVKYLQETFKAEQEKFKAGIVERTKVAEAQQSLAAGLYKLSSAKNDLYTAEKNYEFLVAIKPASLEPSKITPEKLLALKVKFDKGELVAQASNPSLQYTKLAYDAATYRPMVAIAEFSPSIDLQLQASRGFTDTGVSGSTTSRAAVLNFTVPIFNGGQSVSRYKQERANESKARIQYLNSKIDIQADAMSKFYSFLSQQAAYDAIKLSLESAKLVLEGRKEEYAEGINSLTELLRAQNALTVQEINFIDQKLSLLLSYYQMLAVTGRLTVDTVEVDNLENEFLTAR